MSFAIVLSIVIMNSFTIGQEKVIPNDPFYAYQASFDHDGGVREISRRSHRHDPMTLQLTEGVHHNIARAWALERGSKRTIVALVDDGFFFQHEDISDNIWRNIGESGIDKSGLPKETNGIDDDGNGYIDDVIGWDFAFDDPDPDNYAFDGKDVTRIQPYPHSVSAMGIIGARGNNGIGVAGVNWEVSMMLLKIGAQGSESARYRPERTARAIRYAADNGARVINWSGYVSSNDSEGLKLLKSAIEYAKSKGVLLVNSAGNSYKNIDLEEYTIYPACFDNDNLIVVAENDWAGSLYKVPPGSKYIGGSNYGEKNVDIAAFAENFTTRQYNNQSVYSLGGGTSDAAPLVSGVLALLFSARPDLTGAEAKEILLASARRIPALEGKVRCGGIVDAYAALKMALNK